MEIWLQQLLIGLSVGTIYALIALGYTMVYGVIKLINFAHGEVFMIGAFAGYYALTAWGLGFFPALLFAMAVSSVLGVTIERVAYRRLRNSPRLAALTTAIGVSLFLQYVTIYLRGAQSEAYPALLPNRRLELMGASLRMDTVVLLAVAVALMVLLQFIVHRTKVGKAMRAVSFDMEAARLMGISVNRTISATFAIGSALGGAAGVIYGLYYTRIDPLMGILPGLKAFVAAVLGGIGSIPGAMVGGLVIGMVETLVSAAGLSLFRDAAAFLILILILLFRPEGLFGRHMPEKV
ncbi:amino acid/amide ABC transporter membrane protein 1, HAAT family [Thermaerobacter marianensis DSM 12885]|uniref:Amino acid/amide ABC transporter membrane protein 1, HAAT family n=1 Tax=Thermaerobacter marianensis (strain ATCC 700841 / DSM 12885 / JCM 10246 / 7p75a) TaxID=644966 RepID=E6SHS5_THEM7|nr:branched-chain amino acid ABC transporter permease [Thermaerobacter marianensis]ADU50772.1 amino acid/amide ABC transporter membrane protein 1, HAAT family [Thermaerobacter marianensis DSM 12885]